MLVTSASESGSRSTHTGAKSSDVRQLIGCVPVPAERQGVPRQLDVIDVTECGDDRVDMDLEERQQSIVGDIARGDDQQPPRGAHEQVAVPEVSILGDHDATVCVAALDDLAVGRAVSAGQLDRVRRLVSSSCEELREPRWQLRVNQEFHAAESGTMRLRPAARAPNSKAARTSSRSRSG
jgi:hypothetical protein